MVSLKTATFRIQQTQNTVDIYFRFDSIQRQKFYDLKSKSSEIKFLTDNEYAKLEAVINNTLVQVTSIVGSFSRKSLLKLTFLKSERD